MARTYELVMTHKLDADDFFIHRVQQHCAERRLNFFLVEPLWVTPFRERLERGEVRARVLLNMHSEHHEPTDPYHRLVRRAHELGSRVIDPPDVALAAFDKARLHPRLVAQGFTTPPTLIVEPSRAAALTLTAAERELLGSPFVIKPALGYGRKGVILDATNEGDLARSAAAWPDTHYLLQRRVTPTLLDTDPGYFRVYYVFGRVWCCWWNCYTDHYRLVSAAEEERWKLGPLRDLAAGLAALTGMQFFSSEVALTDAGEWVLIDYVNDQCHMLAQSANPRMGVPDALVAAIAERLVHSAQGLIAPTG